MAKAAMITGRPVKICLTREEVFYCHRGRHPVTAIANAVFDAVGVRIDEVPITPEKILRARHAVNRRVGPESFPAIAWPELQHVAPPCEEGDGRATPKAEEALHR